MRRQRGLTLVEMAISVVVFAAIVAVAYPAFMIANDSVSTGTAKDQMQRKGDKLLNEVRDFLRSGRIVAVAGPGNPPAVTIVRPQQTVELAELSADGEVPWRAGQETLRFRPVRTVRELDAEEDLNGDGDRTDSFSLGVLEIVTPNGTRAITESGLVMLGLPSYRGDLDGDGSQDPLLNVVNRSVDIRIRLMTKDARGRHLKTSLASTLRLKNVQR